MANNKNIVAFVGCEGFDIIIYLSRILAKVGRKVLIADHSDATAIAFITPEIKGLNIAEDIVTFRETDFTSKVLDEETIGLYDDILINCCMSIPRISGLNINKVIYITDLHLFHIKHIARLSYYDSLSAENSLIIKDAVNTRLTTQDVLLLLNKNIAQDKVKFIDWNEGDYGNSLIISHGQSFNFRGTSRQLKAWLLQEVHAMNPDMADKKLKVAFKLAKKGR